MKLVVFNYYSQPVPGFGNCTPIPHSTIGLDFGSEWLVYSSLYPLLTYFGMSETEVPAVRGGVGHDTPFVLSPLVKVFFHECLALLCPHAVLVGRLRYEGRVVLLVGVVRAAHQRARGHVLESHLKAGRSAVPRTRRGGRTGRWRCAWPKGAGTVRWSAGRSPRPGGPALSRAPHLRSRPCPR